MKPREIKPGVYACGAIDWERRLFDSLIPLPDGTSYNSYLIRGSDRTALIDTVDPTKTGVLLSNLDTLGVKRLDFVITNHAEQDHSGSLPAVLSRYPEAKVLSTPRCKDMVMCLLPVPEERITVVGDKETVSLGNKTLEFIHFPWVHWPETVLTYLREDRILFSCDLFGSHLATSDLYATDEGRIYEAAKMYYAEIMMPFHLNIKLSWDKLKNYPVDLIAPSHGPLYNKPDFIRDAYYDWVYGEPKNLAVIPYISMHGSTRIMVEHLVSALTLKGIRVEPYDLTVTDLGKLATSLVDAATVVIGTPTTITGAHPLVAYATYLTNFLRPKLKFVSVIGSYGWGGKAVEQLLGLMPNLTLEVIPPVIVRGLPGESDLKALDELAEVIARKHLEANLK